MPRRKRSTEVGEPKTAEVISFQSLKERRDAKRADVWATVHVIQGEGSEGDVVLCRLRDGGYILAVCEGVTGDGGHLVRSPRIGEVAGFVGRVVLVDNVEAG